MINANYKITLFQTKKCDLLHFFKRKNVNDYIFMKENNRKLI